MVVYPTLKLLENVIAEGGVQLTHQGGDDVGQPSSFPLRKVSPSGPKRLVLRYRSLLGKPRMEFPLMFTSRKLSN